MPTVLSVTMAIGSHRLSQQGAITKRMTAIEEMAGMDVLCSDKTGTLTLNKLTVDKNLIEIFSKVTDVMVLILIISRNTPMSLLRRRAIGSLTWVMCLYHLKIKANCSRRNCEDTAVMNECIVGAFFTFMLGLVLLYVLRRKTIESQSKKGQERGMMDSGYEIRSDNTNGECRPDKGSDPDVIIVGAGVAGAALAYTLGKDGKHIRVIERDLSEPDRIVGELLQPGGYLKLMELGLEDCVENIDAQRVVGYALFNDGKSTKLSYPLEKFHSDVAGRSFHNGRFMQRMREKAATLPKLREEL